MGGSAVTEETFEREVLASEKPVIVDFWAPWCGPCLAVAPVLDQIAAERAGELKVVKVNVDEEPGLAVRFGVSSIPTRSERGGRRTLRRRSASRRGTPRETQPTTAACAGSSRDSGSALKWVDARPNLVRSKAGRRDMTTKADSRDVALGIRDVAVVTWRREQLLAAGFRLRASESLARDCGVDLHGLLDLVARGCPPQLAMRILGPLEGESRRC